MRHKACLHYVNHKPHFAMAETAPPGSSAESGGLWLKTFEIAALPPFEVCLTGWQIPEGGGVLKLLPAGQRAAILIYCFIILCN